MTTAPLNPDGAALPRRLLWPRRRVMQWILAGAAAVLAYVVWRAYRDPAVTLELFNAFVFC